MTQHIAVHDTEEDLRIMKNLRNFIGFFAVFAALLALAVTLFAP
jgi:hypothetical protein